LLQLSSDCLHGDQLEIELKIDMPGISCAFSATALSTNHTVQTGPSVQRDFPQKVAIASEATQNLYL
jgi:hypothetical protein